MIVLDASVLIAHLDRSDAHHGRARSLLERFSDESLCASPLTVAEVLVGPARAGRLQHTRDALDALELAEVPLAADASTRLAELRAQTRLRLPDCCVLLAARTAGAGRLATFDERLAAVAAQHGLAAA